MTRLDNFVGSLDFWRLKPDPKLIASQPGQTVPHRYLAGAETEGKDVAIVYVPEDRTLVRTAQKYLGRCRERGRQGLGNAVARAGPEERW